jgi:hypothetical protein
MSETRPHLPGEVDKAMKRAERLAWLSIAFLISIILAMAAVMGGSQAMQTAWIDVPRLCDRAHCRSRQPLGYGSWIDMFL